jgi:abortive infection bacteriophage resistance protein
MNENNELIRIRILAAVIYFSVMSKYLTGLTIKNHKKLMVFGLRDDNRTNDLSNIKQEW